jgi:hypothetical protein
MVEILGLIRWRVQSLPGSAWDLIPYTKSQWPEGYFLHHWVSSTSSTEHHSACYIFYWMPPCSFVAFLALFLEKSPAHKEDSFVWHRLSRISINLLLLTLQWMLHLCLLASQENRKANPSEGILGVGWWPWLGWTSTHFTFTFLSEVS